jgi:hypothetical protein
MTIFVEKKWDKVRGSGRGEILVYEKKGGLDFPIAQAPYQGDTQDDDTPVVDAALKALEAVPWAERVVGLNFYFPRDHARWELMGMTAWTENPIYRRRT